MDQSATTGLVGKWITDPEDSDSLRRYGRVSLEFTEYGRLIYTIHSEGKEEKIYLVYHIQNDMIITNQPSSPREEQTRYLLTSESKLVLFYSDHQSSYVRQH
jgi:hypothetical protein